MVTFDFETKSYADLTKVGAWVYSLHPTTKIICAAYKIEDGPTSTWWPGKLLSGQQAWPDGSFRAYKSMPYDLFSALIGGQEIEAHNVGFERALWMNVCVPEHRWLVPKNDQWRDTMAVACYYALPAALDKLCKVIGLEGKDPEGGRLITRYSKLHLKTAKDEIPQEDFDKFVRYCAKDVEQERQASDFLGDLPEPELAAFQLDQEINMRGMYLDRASLLDAQAIVEERAEELLEEFKSLTGVSPSQNEKARQWFTAHDCPMDNLQAEYIEEVLEGKHDFEPQGEAKRALELRKQFNKASTKKIVAMLRNRADDGRARFQTRYHGAVTGRWTGSGFQPLNLSKGFEDVPPERLIADLTYRSPEWLDIMYGDAMDAVGKASRHHIKASEGNRIIAGDYVSVEAVLLACLAGEEWKIEAFRNKDPIYELMGCEIHRLGAEAEALARENKKAFKEKYPGQRFDGKTGELAFGFQGALGAWRKFDKSEKHSDERVIEICKAWREKHPATKQFWYDLEHAAIKCVDTGAEVEVQLLSFKMIDNWLSVRLPSGKRIWYWDPQLRLGMPQWHKPGEEGYEDCTDGDCDCKPKLRLTYMSQKEGRWQRVHTYGGKLAENVTQATSREILVPSMLKLRDAGYPIILSVYDEIVADVPEDFGSVEEYAEIMLDLEPWAQGWPINVDVWEGGRYKK